MHYNFDLQLQFLPSVLQSPFSWHNGTFSHFLSAATVYNNVFAFSESPSGSCSTDHPHSFPLVSLPLLSNKSFFKLLRVPACGFQDCFGVQKSLVFLMEEFQLRLRRIKSCYAFLLPFRLICHPDAFIPHPLVLQVFYNDGCILLLGTRLFFPLLRIALSLLEFSGQDFTGSLFLNSQTPTYF